MATANVKLTADTSQAVSAMGALKTGWINAAAGIQVVEKAFNMVAGVAGKVNQAIRDQGQFFSAVKDDAALAAVQIATSVTDGMVKPMALAKGANVLMRGDLKLTQEQFNAVAKAAVEMGRATGEDVNNVFDRLTKSIMKGSTEAVSEYGITVAATGPIHKRQSMILEEITKRYGEVKIAVGDAAEAQDAAANRSQLQMLQIAKSADGLSQTLTKFKDFYTGEFLAGGIDALFGTAMSRTNQIAALMDRLQQQSTTGELDAGMKQFATEAERARITLALINDDNAALIEHVQTYVKERAKEIDQLDQNITRNKQILSMASELGLSLDNVFQLNSRIMADEARRAELNAVITAENQRQSDFISGLAVLYKSQLMPVMEQVASIAKTMGIQFESDAQRAAREAAAKKAAEEEARRRETARAASAAQWQRDKEAERAAIDDFYAEMKAAKVRGIQDEIAAEKAARDAAITASQADDLAYEVRKAEQRKRLDDARADLIEENARRATEAQKKAMDADLANRKEYIAKTKDLIEGLSQVTLAAIFAEKKARDGLTKTEYVMKQLAAYMKGEALKYAAKSIGYLAEGVAATLWNPPAAAAAFKASALSAAAAAAFGGGAVAAGAMAGGSGTSAKQASGSSSAAPQREAVGGTTEQRGTVNLIIGGNGVLWGGTIDDLMRKIQDGLNSAGRRGVLRA